MEKQTVSTITIQTNADWKSVSLTEENKIERKTHKNDFNPNLNSCHLSKFAEIFDVGLGLSGGRKGKRGNSIEGVNIEHIEPVVIGWISLDYIESWLEWTLI